MLDLGPGLAHGGGVTLEIDAPHRAEARGGSTDEAALHRMTQLRCLELAW